MKLTIAAVQDEAGVRVVERVPCEPRVPRHTKSYLRAKKAKLGHLLGRL